MFLYNNRGLKIIILAHCHFSRLFNTLFFKTKKKSLQVGIILCYIILYRVIQAENTISCNFDCVRLALKEPYSVQSTTRKAVSIRISIDHALFFRYILVLYILLFWNHFHVNITRISRSFFIKNYSSYKVVNRTVYAYL